MEKRKELLEKAAALTGAKEDEIDKFYSGLLVVIFIEERHLTNNVKIAKRGRNMEKRKELLEKVAALTGAKEDEINKIYSGLLAVIFDDMAGGGYEDALYKEIYDAAKEQLKEEELK